MSSNLADQHTLADVLPHLKLPEKRASSLHTYTINENPFKNNQLVRKYKEIPVHIENTEIHKSDLIFEKLMIDPPQSNLPDQRNELFAFQLYPGNTYDRPPHLAN